MTGNPSEGITCAQCGEPLIGDPGQPAPCPKCGSTNRISSSRGDAGGSALARGKGRAVYYAPALLTLARSVIEEGTDERRFGIAVVIAHMACEIATQQLLPGNSKKKHKEYKLINNPVWMRYIRSTGDKVQKWPFWAMLEGCTERRNKIVHEGLVVGKAEAEDSHKAASDLVAHLEKAGGASR